MNISDIFTPVDSNAGRRWTLTCAGIGGLVGFGLATERVIESATAAILVHAFLNGKLSLVKLNHHINIDSERSQDETYVLQQTPAEAMHYYRTATGDASSVSKLAVSLNVCGRFVDRREALDALLQHARMAWQAKLEPINSVAATLPMLGLLFTLLGLTFAMGDIGQAIATIDIENIASIFDILPLFVGVFKSMAFAMVTTFEGLATALYLRGHIDNTSNALERHLANVELAIRMLPMASFNEADEQEPTSDQADDIAYQILQEGI
ncbi:MotA/TolQ/ExbB proton channel family protein [Rhodopirellula sp. MGV]|uniref:MotA/TolQ/ExbB proton channel family protein n=1 Tax=Rhodopirellula sp. MGV TaxID=2023130 RepID=UPI000B97C95F|nr:MotA/TolQ/ExbB proton channel family protein [Rhodopirellula sp. MGV]OYP28477.1 hypothetical protein CGZ80_27135 [Rhodopirellula sp. MGV]PNY38645.1 hypothetical protein C2E31_01635 [Rhodopirellula baltica]